jgi:hypothetical protein
METTASGLFAKRMERPGEFGLVFGGNGADEHRLAVLERTPKLKALGERVKTAGVCATFVNLFHGAIL